MSADKPEPLERRKGGRPRAEEPGYNLSTWVRASEYDRVIKMAAARGESISATVRSLLALRKPPSR